MQITPDCPCAPVELPDLRNSLIAKWGTSPNWRNAEAQMDKNFPHVTKDSIDSSLRANIRTLATAELFWVGQEMCDLLYGTTGKVPPDTKPNMLTLPAKAGFAVFSKPWYIIGEEIPVDGFAWDNDVQVIYAGEARSSITLTFYNCVDWEAGLSPRQLQLASMMNLQSEARRGTIVQPDGRIGTVLRGRSWMPIGRAAWPLDEQMDWRAPDPQTREVSEISYETTVKDRGMFAAFCTLLTERLLASIQAAPLPRQVRHRDMRERKTSEPSTVKVVYLRRPRREDTDREPGEGKSFQYSYRFPVSAHLKHQPYGPRSSLRKLIVVPSYIKGPEELPLVVKTKVNAWIR